MHRGANARIRPATAEIGRHSNVYLLVCRLLVEIKEGRCLHDLAGLAVAALRHLMLNPRFLDSVQAVGLAQTFNRCHFPTGQISDGKLARANGDSIDVNGAGSALRNAASIFWSGYVELVSQDP